MKNELIIAQKQIEQKIYIIRGVQVMIDKDLAEIYGVKTSRLNEQVKRNTSRFPADFMFQLTEAEWQNLMSQNAISSWGGRRKLPSVFTEQGVASLSAVLKTETAAKVHVEIMRAFVEMRKFLLQNAQIFQRLDQVELKQLATDQKFEHIFKALESKNEIPPQGIFFDGQIFDAYELVVKIVKSAKASLMLIDNYIDETTLRLLSKRHKKVRCHIYTAKISAQLQLDVEKHNAQYEPITLTAFNKSHDRFLIVDEKELFHIGASLKDAGKKWFAFSKLHLDPKLILQQIMELAP